MNSEYMRKMDFLINQKSEQIKQLQLCIFEMKIRQIKNDKKVEEYKVKTDNAVKEMENIKNKYLCSVCFENNKNVVLEPCLHFSICRSCSEKVYKCPICRGDIETILLVFGN